LCFLFKFFFLAGVENAELENVGPDGRGGKSVLT